ncbi:MAG: NAD-dependent epimerase/dehydratase family protein [Betaproteobacteria bacterium]|nr:NAD-dependent epimerase/dehydratase family protein [Betaproteobacteria bacterium]MSQ87916.1 NAD-dependent epimerase/dehydratase family protein [Betaproteobacteria bacterium]
MRIVLTGASGFIGSALVPALRTRGHQVVALDRAAVGDIAGFTAWPTHLAGADAVVHLAALAHAPGVDQERLRAVNVDAALALGKAAAAAGVKMLLMSTVKVLGEETTQRPFDDSSPLALQDAYGRAKAAAETALRAVSGLALTVLRPPLVYGPGVKANFLALMRAVERGWPLPLSSIKNCRSLVYVGNLAHAVVHCLESPLAVGKTYGVSDGAPLSTPALCRALGSALGRPARLFPLPPALLEIAPSAKKLTRSLVVDDSAIRHELGWTPPHTFEEGLRLTAKWLQTQGR